MINEGFTVDPMVCPHYPEDRKFGDARVAGYCKKCGIMNGRILENREIRRLAAIESIAYWLEILARAQGAK